MATEIHQRGLDRLVNLSDAVIAIAATLLILPLVDEAGAIGTQPVSDFLSNNSIQLFVFVLSFVVIARFWLVHHALYRDVIAYNRALLLWNFLWLLSIVFLPFPTELIASGSSDSQTTAALYTGTLVITSLSGFAQLVVIRRTPELQHESMRGQVKLVQAVVPMALLVVAFFLALLLPHVNLWSLLLLALSGPIDRIIRTLRAHRRPA